jgi:hypothetical protein
MVSDPRARKKRPFIRIEKDAWRFQSKNQNLRVVAAARKPTKSE